MLNYNFLDTAGINHGAYHSLCRSKNQSDKLISIPLKSKVYFEKTEKTLSIPKSKKIKIFSSAALPEAHDKTRSAAADDASVQQSPMATTASIQATEDKITPEPKPSNHFFASKINRALTGGLIGTGIGVGVGYLIVEYAMGLAGNPALPIAMIAILTGLILAALFTKCYRNQTTSDVTPSNNP